MVINYNIKTCLNDIFGLSPEYEILFFKENIYMGKSFNKYECLTETYRYSVEYIVLHEQKRIILRVAEIQGKEIFCIIKNI